MSSYHTDRGFGELTKLSVCKNSALVGGVDANGKSIFEGRSFTGFSNAEEEAVDQVKVS